MKYGSGLRPEHQAMLEASTVPPDIAHERGYVTAGDKTQLARHGFSKTQQRVPGLLVPLWNVHGEKVGYQLRPDKPRTNGNGKAIKYETPAGGHNIVDCHPRIRDRIGDPTVALWITEGAKKADAAIAHSLVCLAIPGVWSWKGRNSHDAVTALGDWEAVALKGRRVYLAFDSDVMSKPAVHVALDRFGRFLESRGADVRYVYLPDAPDGSKVGLDDYLAGGGTVDQIVDVSTPQLRPLPEPEDEPEIEAEAAPPPEPRSLAEIESTFRKWMHLPDVRSLYFVLGVIAANYLPGDPVWGQLVGAPGSGKTEQLNAALGLPDVHPAATLTEASLLSGVAKKDIAAGAKGGLLREVGTFGIVLLKDFTSLLSMNRDARAGVLAALREVYDGAWTRHVGTDGGKQLHWEGKCGLIAGCTPAIDKHYAVTSSLGERFILYRLPVEDRPAQARRALARGSSDAAMRTELAAAVAGLFAKTDLTGTDPPPSGPFADAVVTLAELAVRCRSAVYRDHRGEIEMVPEPEAPARMALVLARLHAGMIRLGVTHTDAWAVLVKAALDSMPQVRHQVLDIIRKDGPRRTKEVAEATALPTSTARRSLEDLVAHGVLERRARGVSSDEDADKWAVADWAAASFTAIGTDPPDPVSEIREDLRGDTTPTTASISPTRTYERISETAPDSTHPPCEICGTPCSWVDDDGRHIHAGCAADDWGQ